MRFFLTIAALLATMLFAAELNAQDPPPEFNWTNATGDNSWGNEDNWNLGGDGTPGPGSDVNINGGVGRTRYFLGFTTNPTTLDLGPAPSLISSPEKLGFLPTRTISHTPFKTALRSTFSNLQLWKPEEAPATFHRPQSICSPMEVLKFIPTERF